jgi:tryptophan 7-halogenase
MIDGGSHLPRRIGVLGGGTAGYLAALAFHRHVPDATVEVIEAKDIPIIGVGESTVPGIVGFLRDFLGLPVDDFYREVQPTWKLGGRFVWGLPGDDYRFNFPFEKMDHGAAHLQGVDVRRGALRSVLMEADKSLLMPAADDDGYEAIVRKDYAYHLDNRSLIAFLRGRIGRAGISNLDARIEHVDTDERRERVTGLRTSDGRTLTYDLYVDCSGFRSVLLGQALGEAFVDFSSSLFTNTAIIGERPHGGRIKSCTTCYAMNCGWTWIIPMRTEDHLGYVFSSAHCTVDEAAAELEATLGVRAHPHVIRFPSGRHTRAWAGNVVAVGNASGFVEPLQSTGVQMTAIGVRDAILALLAPDRPAAIDRYNEAMRARWDFLRGFVAMHYRFNKRFDTPFWRDCRREADLAGIEGLVAYFHERGLLSLADDATRDSFRFLWDAGLFGTNGIDIMLLGMGERPPAGSLPADEGGRVPYSKKRRVWEMMSARALPQSEALQAIEGRFHLLQPYAG